MSAEVVRVLNELGPSLGSVLARKLQADYSLNPAAARKRIERAKTAKQIIALEDLRFRHNEQFLYLADQLGSIQFLKGLQRAFLMAGSPLGDCLSAIDSRGGIIPKAMFWNLSGLPIQGPAKLSAEGAMALLLKWRLIHTTETSLGTTIQLNSDVFPKPISPGRAAARLRAEQAFLYALLDWLRLQGLVTPGKASLRLENDCIPQFGFFAWDLVSPSYLSPLTLFQRNDEKLLPGFVVADVCLGRTLTLADVEYFINKCNTAKSQLNRPCISFLVARWFEKDALLAGRKHGLLFTTPKNLFGQEFSDVLDSMIDLLDEQGIALASKGQQISELLEKLKSMKHLEGVLGNVLADTFELITGHCLQGAHGGKVSYGRKFAAYDSDVLLLHPEKRVVAVECKKKVQTSLVNKEEVEHWFGTVVPVIYQELMRDRWFKDVPFEFSIWTTSDFHSDALVILENLAKSEKYEITWRNGKQVMEEIEKTRDTRLKNSFKHYYLS